MKAILFDMDGVLYEGDTPIPGADRVISWCREQGIPHLFLTNTTSRPRSALAAKLAGMGIVVEVDEILTPPRAAVAWLERHGKGEVALFVPEKSREEFESVAIADDGASQVGAVVLGDLGAGWDFATYNRAFRLLMENPGAPLIALGLTRYWQAEDGLRLDVGPYVKGLEYAAGREALVLGKPAGAFFRSALALLGVEPEAAVMIGDDIRGDVEGAQQAGIPALLVRTGKFRESDLEQGIKPDAVLDSVVSLPDWWERNT